MNNINKEKDPLQEALKNCSALKTYFTTKELNDLEKEYLVLKKKLDSLRCTISTKAEEICKTTFTGPYKYSHTEYFNHSCAYSRIYLCASSSSIINDEELDIRNAKDYLDKIGEVAQKKTPNIPFTNLNDLNSAKFLTDDEKREILGLEPKNKNTGDDKDE